MLRHMCTCVLNHACKMALYFASCLAPPSATAANACEMLLASFRRSLTLAEPSCEHTCKFMNCNINMTIAGGWQHKNDDNSNTASGWQRWDWQWPGQTQSGWDWQWSGSTQASASSSTGTAAADEVQMENYWPHNISAIKKTMQCTASPVLLPSSPVNRCRCLH